LYRRVAVGLVPSERFEVVALPVRDETSHERIPPEGVLPVPALLKIPGARGRLLRYGITEVEWAVLALRLDHYPLLPGGRRRVGASQSRPKTTTPVSHQNVALVRPGLVTTVHAAM